MTIPDTLPKVSIDLIPLRVLESGKIQVGTLIRDAEPFEGARAFPGVLLLSGERLQQAGFRALKTKAGIHADGVREMRQVGTFDEVDRDPRGHTLSIAMAVVIENVYHSELEWFDLNKVPELAFDHNMILAAALLYIDSVVWTSAELMHAFLGKEFTTAKAYTFANEVSERPIQAGNMTRKLKNSSLLKESGQSEPQGRGRPATIWAVA